MKNQPDTVMSLDDFLVECGEVGAKDLAAIKRIALATIKYLHGDDAGRAAMRSTMELEERWYAGLKRGGEPDWAVYETDEYLAELWACWAVYSRKYLTGITSPKSLAPAGIAADIGIVTRAVDLGCGIGLTTALLKLRYPDADVVGTNLDDTQQMRLAIRLSARFGFRTASKLDGGRADLVFASEFFEHIPEPLKYLNEVLDVLEPRTMLIANSFTARAIGHFPSYIVSGKRLDGKTTAKLFNTELRRRGYEKVKTKLWNARPAYWRRSGVPGGAAAVYALREVPKDEPKEQTSQIEPLSAEPVAFETEPVLVSDLRPHPRNYRMHPDDQLAHIAESIRIHGFYRNVVVARDGTILAGHGVVEASKKLGLTTIPVVRLDIAPNSAKALKLLAGDNEISRIAGIDDRALTELLKEIQGAEGLLGTGYDEKMLAALVMVTRPTGEIADFDAAAEWVGMPEHVVTAQPLRLILLFDDEEHRKEAIGLLGIKTTYGKKSVVSAWWPDKPRENVMALKYVVGEETDGDHCSFETNGDGAWRCVTHDAVTVAKEEPVYCAKKQEEQDREAVGETPDAS